MWCCSTSRASHFTLLFSLSLHFFLCPDWPHLSALSSSYVPLTFSDSFPVLTCECPPVCECPLLARSDSFTYSHPGSCHPSLPALFPPQTLSFHVLTCPSVFAKVSAPCLDPFRVLISIGLHQARSKHVCGMHCTSCECPSLTWILSVSLLVRPSV